MKKSKFIPKSAPILAGYYLYIIYSWYYDAKRKPLENGVGADHWFPVVGHPTTRVCLPEDLPEILAAMAKDERSLDGMWKTLVGNVQGARKFRVRQTQVLSEQWLDY